MIGRGRDGEGKKRKETQQAGDFSEKRTTNYCTSRTIVVTLHPQPTQQLGEGRRTSNAIVISLYIERNICNSHF